MKFNKWTLGLAALGVVSLASAARADEKLSPVQTALSNTTLSGYVDVAANWRPGTDSGSAGGPNIPASAFSKNDGFSLNAVDLALDKPMDEGPWASGYHVELMFGPNSVPAANNFFGGAGGSEGFGSLRQAYVSLRTPVGNGIDWNVGVFDTIIGYESTSGPLNPNYTRSYGYSIEPTTHTGVLASYKVTDVLTLSAGVANTWNANSAGLSGVNNNATYESQKTYMGSITLTAPESFGALKGATLTLGAINGVDQSIAAGGPGSQTSWYAGLALPTPSSKLKLGAAFDYLTFNNRGGANTKDDSIWVAGLYTTISPTDKLSFNFRGEIVDATQIGSSIVAPVSPNPLNGYYAGHYAGEVTATMQYQLWANVLSRVEFRWDHVDADSGADKAFGVNNTKRNDFLLALNLVYQF